MSDVVPRSISDDARGSVVAEGEGDVGVGVGDAVGDVASTVALSPTVLSTDPVPNPSTAAPASTAATNAARRRGSSLDHQLTLQTPLPLADPTFCR
jgi:hypothetical protein